MESRTEGARTLKSILNTPDVEEIQKKLVEHCKHKSRYEVNFQRAQNGLTACFAGAKLYITDGNLLPMLEYESTSLFNACAVSDTGKYIICQTAYNKQNDENSGITILFDVKGKREISSKRIETGWKGVTHIFVDENERCIWFYYDDFKIKYDFELKAAAEDITKYEEKHKKRR